MIECFEKMKDDIIEQAFHSHKVIKFHKKVNL